MRMIDVNVAFGRTRVGRSGFETADDLLAEMDRLGIDEAVVHHVLAAEGDVRLGNRLLIEALQGHRNLHLCWVMAPPALGDLPDPREWVREAIEAGVRAVRLFPAHSLYTLSPWCMDPLLDAVEEATLPVFIDFGTHHWSQRVIPWDPIKVLCERHAGLDVAVVGATVGETRDAVSLMHVLPNLYLELHAFAPPDGLALLAREGLAERLLLGTGLPYCAGECVVEHVRRAALNPGQLEAVAGGNVSQLLHNTPTPRSAKKQRTRPTVNGPVIDAHAHIGAWERTITPVRTPEAIVASMDRCGVDKIVMSSLSAIHGEMRLGNREMSDAAARFPERLYGYAAIHPHYPEEIPGELKRCFEDGVNFVGLKLHCGLHGAQLHDPGYEPALGFANEHGLPVLVHGGGQDDWVSVAQSHPRAKFIMAHACAWDGNDPAGKALYAPASEIPNLFVDVAGSAAHRGAMRALVDLVGADNVLFGSDFPMFDLAFELGRVTFSELTPAEKNAVCGGNALRIFKRLNG